LVSPKYFGTLKGKFIKAIAVDGLREWREIRDKTGLDDNQIKSITDELRSDGILERRSSGFWVDYDLWIDYKAHFGDEWAIKKKEELKEEREEKERLLALMKKKEIENRLRNRVLEWLNFKKINVNKIFSHVYLKGDLLDSLLRDLIPLSKKEILVVNPYLQKSALCDLFSQGIKNGVDVQVITRSPEKDKYPESRRAKIVYHKTLIESGIQLFYNENVHAKIFILDKQVLSASSMNLYSESIGGKLWEAGIVSIDPTNLKMALESYQQLIKDPYTNKIT